MDRRGGWARSQILRPQENHVLYKSFTTLCPPSSLFVFLLYLLVGWGGEGGGGGSKSLKAKNPGILPIVSALNHQRVFFFSENKLMAYVLGESVLAHPGQDQRGILQELQPAQPHQAGIEPAAACPSLIFSTSNICLLVLQKISLLSVLGGYRTSYLRSKVTIIYVLILIFLCSEFFSFEIISSFAMCLFGDV
jgi:hypothetical protein